MIQGPRYLVRFDDLCPTANWEVWNRVEDILVDLDIRPIVAVVPDNRDEVLRAAPPAADFWDRVRAWQARDWSIALHGYQHLYSTRNGGLLGSNRCSEFAGLPEAVQAEKIRRGLAIFRREGITADAWTAPAHSFDIVTLKVLADNGLPLVSDGFTRRPYRDGFGLLWVPQQLCDFAPCRAGVWTVCFHSNSWGKNEMTGFEHNLARYRPMITSLPQIKFEREWGRGSPGDMLQARIFKWTRWSRFPIARIVAKLMYHGVYGLHRS